MKQRPINTLAYRLFILCAVLVFGMSVVGSFLSEEHRSFLFLSIPLGFCALIAMQIAENRGHSPRNWAIAGFLLGPLGIVFALIEPANQQALDEKAVQQGAAKPCPACCELVKMEATRCRYCGEALSVDD